MKKKPKTENTAQHGLDTTIRKQSQRTQIRHEPSYKQEVKIWRYCLYWPRPTIRAGVC